MTRFVPPSGAETDTPMHAESAAPHTLAGFAANHGIIISPAPDLRESNPNMDGSADMDHWRVTLRHGSRRYTLTFSKGRGHNGAPPSVSEVLECVQSDATYPDMSFEEWCRELGYDEDSRRAERTYNAVVKQTERARALIGDDLWTDFLDAQP